MSFMFYGAVFCSNKSNKVQGVSVKNKSGLNPVTLIMLIKIRSMEDMRNNCFCFFMLTGMFLTRHIMRSLGTSDFSSGTSAYK